MTIDKQFNKYKSLLERYSLTNYGDDEVNYANRPIAFLDLAADEQIKLVEYCTQSFIHRVSPNHNWSSYGLKHFFENEEPNSFYVLNGQFKGAMLIAGFFPVATETLNWFYCISQKSPALVKHNKLSVKMV